VKAGTYRIKVTSAIGSMGANEAATDTRPVSGATVQLGGVRTHTNQSGVALVKARHARRLTVTAGDTLVPAKLKLPR
jgi:hypothetical protein